MSAQDEQGFFVDAPTEYQWARDSAGLAPSTIDQLIMMRFGATVEPVDPLNRSVHRGDFGLRIPTSQAAMREFFARWREQLPYARKYAVACRDYVMTKIAYLSGARAAGLCPVTIGDIHWEHGQWGRFVVQARALAARDTAPRGLHVPRGARAALVVHRGGPGGVRRRR